MIEPPQIGFLSELGWHRADLDEGIILLYRRAQSQHPVIEIKLHGLNPSMKYKLAWDLEDKEDIYIGSELMNDVMIELKQQASSEMIHYKKI